MRPPGYSAALAGSYQAGVGHLNLDGTVVRTGRVPPRTTEADLLPALEKTAAEDEWLTLTELGYVNLRPAALRHPMKKSAGRELTDGHKAYNRLTWDVHGIAEHVNSLLKTTFKALRRVSLDQWRIGAITGPHWSCSSSNTAAPSDQYSPTVTNPHSERLSVV